MMTGSLDEYTDQEFINVLVGLIESATTNPFMRPSDNERKAILLGGQSGAGKTTLHEIYREVLHNNVIVINGDEYRKAHPRSGLLQAKYGDGWVEHTAAWSGKMTEALIDRLSKIGYNLIIEGTLRTSAVPLKTAQLLRERGYDVSLALIAVKPEISLVSCQIRYEEMRIAGTTPRATDPAHHAKIVHDIVDNLETLENSGVFSEVRLFTRSEECIYPAEGITAAEALQNRLFGPWTDEEQGHYQHLLKRLEALQEK